MAQISIIKKSNITQARRFDAEYFKPEYLEIEKKLEKFLFNNEVSIIRSGTTPKDRDENLKEGIILLKTGNIRNNILDNDSTQYFYIDESTNKKMKSTELQENDVLLNIVGATTDVIGRTSLIRDNFPKSNITQAMAFCRVFNKKVNPFFLFIFFQTVFGKSQIKRLARPTGQFNLNLNEIGRLKIPILPQSFQLQIEKIVKEAHQKQNTSKENYKKAEEILLKELDLLNFEIKHQLTFIATKKAIDQAKRFDSEYFQPKYEEIIKHIENYKNGFCEVGELVKWKKGFEIGSEEYLEEGFDFGRVSDFTKYGFENISKKIDEKNYLELKENFKPKIGEILFTKDGTIGISYLLKEEFHGILSSAFLRLSTKTNFDKETLTLILNSILVKMQVEKLSGGAIINHLKPSEFEKIKIPLIDETIQNQIKDLIEESHTLRKESKALLEKAKKMVENEIDMSVKKNDINKER